MKSIRNYINLFKKDLSIFAAPEGSPITLFTAGQPCTDLKVVCFCGFLRSDINILPRDLCPICGGHMVTVKARRN